MRTGSEKKVRTAVWLFPLSVMVLIFFFSAQQAEESSALSGSVVEALYRLCLAFLPDLTLEAFAEALTWPVRKFAHMGEFTLLYLSFRTAFAFGSSLGPRVKRAFWSLFATGLYACSDEVHQIFVPGRAGRISDVLIDLALPLFISLLVLLSEKQSQKRNRSA